MFDSLRRVLLSLLGLLVILVASAFLFGESVNGARLVVIYAVVTLALPALAYLQKANPRVREGWHHLTPSAMEWLALVGSVAMNSCGSTIFWLVAT